MVSPRGLVGVIPDFEAYPCINASTRVKISLEIPLTCLLVTSSVLAISRAVSRVRVASLSRSLVYIRLELDPNMRANVHLDS